MSKLKINTITYQRVKNLGNYETERLEVSISIDENEDPDFALKKLKFWVDKKLSLIEKPSKDEVNDAKHLIQIDEEWDELY